MRLRFQPTQVVAVANELGGGITGKGFTARHLESFIRGNEELGRLGDGVRGARTFNFYEVPAIALLLSVYQLLSEPGERADRVKSFTKAMQALERDSDKPEAVKRHGSGYRYVVVRFNGPRWGSSNWDFDKPKPSEFDAGPRMVFNLQHAIDIARRVLPWRET